LVQKFYKALDYKDRYLEQFSNHVFGETYKTSTLAPKTYNGVIHIISESEKIEDLTGVNLALVPSYHNLNSEKIAKDARHLFNSTTEVVILDGEPNNIDGALENSNFVITTKKEIYRQHKECSQYLPYYITFMAEDNICPYSFSARFPPDKKQRSHFCFFAYSNGDERYDGVRARKKFYYLAQQMTGGRISNHGKCYGGDQMGGKTYYDNRYIMSNYKFVIAIENSRIPGYITEKLLNPIIAGSIPIYLGDPEVGKRINLKRIINIADFDSFEDCIQYVLKVDSDPVLFREIQSQPVLPYEIDSEKFKTHFSYLLGGKFYRNIFTRSPRIAKNIKPSLFYENDIRLVTFADGSVFTTDRLVAEAKRSGFFKSIDAFDANTLKESNTSAEIFCRERSQWIKNNKKGFGYYIWKSRAVLNSMENAKDGDIIVWCDSGCSIININRSKMSTYYIDFIDSDSDVMCFPMKEDTYLDSTDSKSSLINRIFGSFEQYKENAFTDKQITTAFIIFKKTTASINLVKQWDEISQLDDYKFIDESVSLEGERESFRFNRYDQSIVSLLIKKFKSENTLKVIYKEVEDSSANTDEPIQRSRIIRNGISHQKLSSPYWSLPNS
jgi:hypothetical protein